VVRARARATTLIADRASPPPDVSRYELFIIGITGLALFNLVLLVVPVSADVKDVVRIIDVPLSLILLADFAARLLRAPSRRYYNVRDGGWLDLLGSLSPPPLKLLRIPPGSRS
jgi:hypothetical protein